MGKIRCSLVCVLAAERRELGKLIFLSLKWAKVKVVILGLDCRGLRLGVSFKNQRRKADQAGQFVQHREGTPLSTASISRSLKH